MMEYNYLEAVKADIREYINEEISLDDFFGNRFRLENYLKNDRLLFESVTGNAAGSYNFNRDEAAECVLNNLELLTEAINNIYGSNDVLKTVLEIGPESCDIAIRCYILSQAISEVLDEMGF